jgi:hypothetical protein
MTHDHEVISIIDDSTDDEHKPVDPKDTIVIDSLDENPIPEEIPVAAKELVETEDQEPERLCKGWAKTKESKRDKT